MRTWLQLPGHCSPGLTGWKVGPASRTFALSFPKHVAMPSMSKEKTVNSSTRTIKLDETTRNHTTGRTRQEITMIPTVKGSGGLGWA